MIHPWNEPAWRVLLGGLDRLPHAILVSGQKGIGKLEFASALAGRLLCETAGPMAEACGTCQGCRLFGAQTHPDFRLIEPEALGAQGASAVVAEDPEEKSAGPAKRAKPSIEIKVEQIRDLADFLNIGSHRAGRRIVLVYPAEQLSKNAANSLLKALEEPPSGAMFILVSNNPTDLLPTIRSRCVVVALRVPAAEIGGAWLAAQGVAGAKGWLKFYGGAPLLAKAKLDAGPIDTLAELLGASPNDRGRLLGKIKEREDIARLIDALQKYSLDRALVAAGAAPKYLQMRAARTSADDARKWVATARRLGRHREIGSHPLNSLLFVNQIISELN